MWYDYLLKLKYGEEKVLINKMMSMKKLWYCRFLNLYKYSILQSDILYQIATSNILLYFHMVYNCQENKSRILIFLRENSHSLKQLNIFNTYYAYIVVNVIRGIHGLSQSIQVLESNEERKVMVDGARWWRWGEHWTRYINEMCFMND